MRLQIGRTCRKRLNDSQRIVQGYNPKAPERRTVHPIRTDLGCLQWRLLVLRHGRMTLCTRWSRAGYWQWSSGLTNCNAVFIPFHSENSSSLWVKIRTVRRPTPLSHATTGVAINETIAVCMVHAVAWLEGGEKDDKQEDGLTHWYCSSEVRSSIQCASCLLFRACGLTGVLFAYLAQYAMPLGYVRCHERPLWCRLHRPKRWDVRYFCRVPRYKRTYGQFPPTVQKAGQTADGGNKSVDSLQQDWNKPTASPRCSV